MRRIASFTCLLLLATLAVAGQDPDELVLARKFTFHSGILREERPYWVYLPPSYEQGAASGRKYPVLYLLDGRAHLNALTGIVHHLGSASSAVWRMPEVIVVALQNTQRTRDFTPTHVTSGPYSENSGGAAAFIRFLKEEFIPEIESRYRATPERTLVGHSLGGLLVLNTFIEQPSLFENYIAIDPSLWWDGKVLVNRLQQQDRKPASRVSVYIAMAAHAQDEELHVAAIQQFRSILELRADSSLRVRYQYFEDETHLSVPLIAIYRGLLFAYDGYQRPADPSTPAPSAGRK